MLQAYDDEDNVPMVFESLPLPYRIRTWEEVIKEWEGKLRADAEHHTETRRNHEKQGIRP